MKKNIYKLLSLPALLLAPGLLAAGNPAQQTPWDARCLLTKRSEP